MTTVFLSLVGANLVIFLGAILIAARSHEWGTNRHAVLGIFSLVLTCLIQVLVFTYFTVTSKIIAQAAHLGRLETDRIHSAKALKRQVTFSQFLLITLVVWSAATGGSSWRSGGASIWHSLAAMLTLFAHVAVWPVQYRAIGKNSRLLKETLEEYQKARSSHRGLQNKVLRRQ